MTHMMHFDAKSRPNFQATVPAERCPARERSTCPHLPRKNGVEVLRQLRASGAPRSQTPVLMLTARGDDIDRILGLELGADDYVPKPCTPRELVARLRAILRRGHRHQPAVQHLAGGLPDAPDSQSARYLARAGRRQAGHPGTAQHAATAR
jgi:DNA-binding response OmpR family regulator